MARDLGAVSSGDNAIAGVTFVCLDGVNIKPEMEEIRALAPGLPLNVYSGASASGPLMVWVASVAVLWRAYCRIGNNLCICRDPQSVAQGLRPDQVLAIVTPAAIVQEMFLTRCQRNTVRGAQVCGGAQVPAAMQKPQRWI
jgi:hypothetical protein